MVSAKSYSSYKDTQIKTASPMSLIILLYDGVLKNIQKGMAGLKDEGQYRESASYLLKAGAIVTELMSIINPSVSPNLATGLSASYQHVLRLISEASKQKDPALLMKAIEIMSSLRLAWLEVAQESERQVV